MYCTGVCVDTAGPTCWKITLTHVPDHPLDIFNVIANTATVFGVIVALYVLVQVRRIAQRLESVLAPKTGIEGFLNLCAQVIEADPDGTCVVADKTGEIVMVNRRFEEMTGYHRSEVVGQPVEIMLPDQYKGVHPGHREDYLTTPSNRPMRGLSFRHKRGREVAAGIWLGHFNDPNDGYTIVKMRAENGDWQQRSGEMTTMHE